MQCQSSGSSWKLQSQWEFQYAHSRFDFKKKITGLKKKVSLMTQPVSNYAGNTIQTLIDTP